MSPAAQRQPWPLKWIALAIILFLIPYTVINLYYRKPGRAFRPYQDMKDRANVLRLLSAGFQRVTLDADLAADAIRPGTFVKTAPAAGGLPPALRETLIEKPSLPDGIVSVTAAPISNSLFSYAIAFTCTLTDNKHQLAGGDMYVHGEEVVITPEFEPLAGGLLARTREREVILTIPAHVLKPGHYRVTLVGLHSSRSWPLQVK